ncbi:hypothetical protein [Schinkia azotoformans]|uniref:hypothetical protein n=1 Tax=Schinkia azotoformans TaxID=1454 RepID=UPI003D2AAEC3
METENLNEVPEVFDVSQLLVELQKTNEVLYYILSIQGFFIALLIMILFFVAKGSGTSAK